tara:strand:- start:4999 stop:5169 length:171 start_codon:yes stop_codon:yes gene_type:complete
MRVRCIEDDDSHSGWLQLSAAVATLAVSAVTIALAAAHTLLELPAANAATGSDMEI